MSFKTNLYEVVRNVISDDLIQHLDIQFELLKKIKYLTEGKDERNLYEYADSQIAKSFSYCLINAFFGSVKIERKVALSKGSM